jgi:nitrite reductase (NADH) small subunit
MKMLWHKVCKIDDILPFSGVCAKVEGHQVAIFRVAGDQLFAISNFDPFTCANVLSRGIVGNKGEVWMVASPLLKHRFNLRTGECLDDPQVRVPTYPVRVVGREVFVAVVADESLAANSPLVVRGAEPTAQHGMMA